MNASPQHASAFQVPHTVHTRGAANLKGRHKRPLIRGRVIPLLRVTNCAEISAHGAAATQMRAIQILGMPVRTGVLAQSHRTEREGDGELPQIALLAVEARGKTAVCPEANAGGRSVPCEEGRKLGLDTGGTLQGGRSLVAGGGQVGWMTRGPTGSAT
jgi:hypothetical protein